MTLQNSRKTCLVLPAYSQNATPGTVHYGREAQGKVWEEDLLQGLHEPLWCIILLALQWIHQPKGSLAAVVWKLLEASL